MRAARDRNRWAGGFSLVEVLVALVVLEVCLLGVLGSVVLAQRRMAEAAELIRATGAAEAVADSLLAGGPVAPGERIVPPFRIRWMPGDGLRVEVIRDGGGEPAGSSARTVLDIDARAATGPDP